MDIPLAHGLGTVALDKVPTASIVIPTVDLLPGTVFICF